VLLADQAEPNDPDADAVIGTEDAAIRGSRHDRRTCCAQEFTPGGLLTLDGAVERPVWRILHNAVLSSGAGCKET
jgi:hypothetical protein